MAPSQESCWPLISQLKGLADAPMFDHPRFRYWKAAKATPALAEKRSEVDNSHPHLADSLSYSFPKILFLRVLLEVATQFSQAASPGACRRLHVIPRLPQARKVSLLWSSASGTFLMSYLLKRMDYLAAEPVTCRPCTA